MIKRMMMTAAVAVALSAVAIPRSYAAPKELVDLSNAFSDVAEEVIPSVVVITNLQKPQMQRRQRGFGGLPPEFREFFGIPSDPVDPNPRSSKNPIVVGRGSGVIIQKDGYLVTNHHVIKDADYLEVTLNDGKVYNNFKDKDSVKVVGIDEDTDLAVLKISDEEESFKSASFADSSKVRVGEWAIAVGAPFNLDYSVTVGVVSQKGRYDVNMNAVEDYIQTDASINPGNSGGPLLNIHGEVLGINNFIYTGGMGKGNIGLGFAISSNLVKKVSNSLIENGKVIRPWLGISMQQLTPDLKKALKVEKGVFISEVISGDPADKAGLEPGDIILKVGDKEVDGIHDVQFAVLDYDPGDKIKVLVNRDGKEKTFKIKARAREGSDTDPAGLGSSDILADLGLTLGEDDGEIVIEEVMPGSAAYRGGLRKGAKILKINRTKVESIEDVIELLKEAKGDQVLFYIVYRGRQWYAPVTVE